MSTRSKPSPALTFQSEHYPAEWGRKVPTEIRMLKTVRPDLPVPRPGDSGSIAEKGKVYPCWVNSHGAMSVKFDNGRALSVRQGEFEIVSWTPPGNAA